jgi:pimeloyl-ACP methyl ester carboxylesterase
VIPTRYLYLHGFASSPRSAKAEYFHERFRELQLPLEIPDLNGEDFSPLSVSRQLERVASGSLPADAPVTAIGSSLGGLTAAWLAQKYRSVRRLILLAPAFGFPYHPFGRENGEILREWERSGWLSVYHHGYRRSVRVPHELARDAGNYRESGLTRPVPTLILHGRFDEVIPIDLSREYARCRPHVKLLELDSDHALTDVMPLLWREIRGMDTADTAIKNPLIRSERGGSHENG